MKTKKCVHSILNIVYTRYKILMLFTVYFYDIVSNKCHHQIFLETYSHSYFYEKRAKSFKKEANIEKGNAVSLSRVIFTI